jgi:hypothetical protein
MAIFLLNRHHYENFALIKKSLRTTIAKGILFNAVECKKKIRQKQFPVIVFPQNVIV